MEVVIGLEVHVELGTATKLFCGCSTRFGAAPNSQVCPVCLGLPGTLPVLNFEAVKLALRAALALGAEVSTTSTFARKHYFYPDQPKGYQITQQQPLAQGGELKVGGGVQIDQLHLEEDAGKLVHTQQSTLVDYNRSGIPLVEIVTEPCINSPAQAREFVTALKQVVEYCQISDARMEEGSLRCDANISLQQPGKQAGTPTEIKNLNSLRAVERALEYEVKRHRKLLIQGKEIKAETLHWDEKEQKTVPLRSKASTGNYRLLPEADLPPLIIEKQLISTMLDSLPELPLAKKARFQREHGLSEPDAAVLTDSCQLAAWFDDVVRAGAPPQLAANWARGEVSRLLNQSGLVRPPFSPEEFVQLLQFYQRGEISPASAKQVLAEMFTQDKGAEDIIQQRGLTQINSREQLLQLIAAVIEDNSAAVADYRAGKTRAFGYLMGQAMARSQGRANPERLRELLTEQL